MKNIKRIGLFLSSFVPLFMLLIIKELLEIINDNWTFNLLNSMVLIALVIMFFIGIFYLFAIIKEINNCNGEEIVVTTKQNTTDQHFLGYFSLFVLFAISFEIEMYSMAVIFFLVLGMIAIVYIKNDMYFINPLLNILGYSFYNIEYVNKEGKKVNCKVFYKGAIVAKSKYILCTKYSNMFFLKKQ